MQLHLLRLVLLYLYLVILLSAAAAAAQQAAAESPLLHLIPSSAAPAISLSLRSLQRCAGIRGSACSAYYSQTLEDGQPAQPSSMQPKACPTNPATGSPCGRGVCHADTGLCDCPAGVGGPSCSEPDLRPCTNRYRTNRSSSVPAGHLNSNKRDSSWLDPGWTPSRCAGVCDDATATCFCDGAHFGRVPALPGSPPGTPAIRPGRLLHGNCQRLTTDDAGRPLRWGARAARKQGGMSFEDIYGAQGWCTVDKPRVRCSCDLDGYDGQLCETVTETVCPNQCSGRGSCDRGFCKCFAGWFGLDCARLADASATPNHTAAAAAAAATPEHVSFFAARPYLQQVVVQPRPTAAVPNSQAPTAAAGEAPRSAGSNPQPHVSSNNIPAIYFTPISLPEVGGVSDAQPSRRLSSSSSSTRQPRQQQVEDRVRTRSRGLSWHNQTAAAPVTPQQQQQQHSFMRTLQRHFWTGGGSQRPQLTVAPRQQAVTAAVHEWLSSGYFVDTGSGSSDGSSSDSMSGSGSSDVGSSGGSSGSSSSRLGGAGLGEALSAAGVQLDRLGGAGDQALLQQMVEGALGAQLPGGKLRRPRIFVYDMPSRFVSRLLQYRSSKQTCTWRVFSKSNFSLFTTTEAQSSWRYPLESHLHELMLQSPHRTLDPQEADFFYVPVYAACMMEAVAGWADAPWWHMHSKSDVKQGVLMYQDALDWVRSTRPHWNASGGADHVWLFSHDEGACWAPSEIYNASIILSQWGRLDQPSLVAGSSLTGTGPVVMDSWTSKWSQNWNKFHPSNDDPLAGLAAAPGGGSGSNGYTQLLTHHPCYTPGKDLVLPAFRPPQLFHASPFLGGAAAGGSGSDDGSDPQHSRDVLLLLRGDMGRGRPPAFSQGLRQELAALAAAGDWRRRYNAWVGTQRELPGDRSALLARSRYCLVVPLDGWSGTFEDAVLHGCIPVVVQGISAASSSSSGSGSRSGDVAQPFSSLLRLESASVEVSRADLPNLPSILLAIPPEQEEQMRAALGTWWHRMAWLTHPFVRAQAAGVVGANLQQHPWVQQRVQEQQAQQQQALQGMGGAAAAEAAAAAAEAGDQGLLIIPAVLQPAADSPSVVAHEGAAAAVVDGAAAGDDTTNSTTAGSSVPQAAAAAAGVSAGGSDAAQEAEKVHELFRTRVWQPDAPLDDAFTTLMQWLHHRMLHPYRHDTHSKGSEAAAGGAAGVGAIVGSSSVVDDNADAAGTSTT